MLKFLTHKLRTHSLNEDSVSQKVEERDSGTESDDEADIPDNSDFCTDVAMKWNFAADISMSGGEETESCACPAPPHAPCPTPPQPDDQLYDHHSSEEELEVINASGCEGGEGREDHTPAPRTRRRGASSPPPLAAAGKRKYTHPAESDDDDTKVETPVRFRTSPPREALKPWRSGAAPRACSEPAHASGVCSPVPLRAGDVCSPVPLRAGSVCSPVPLRAGGVCSPVPLRAGGVPLWRRRRTQAPAPRRHRPALDFDKMQQLKVVSGGPGGVRSWRAVGGAAGELSVFCW